MNIDIKDMKLKHWAILGAVLLVLVGIWVAYDVFVPKVRELEALQQDLVQARAEQTKLQAVPVAARPTDSAKLAVSVKVPTSHDQSRFLKTLRTIEVDSRAVIKSLEFGEVDADTQEADQTEQAKEGEQGLKLAAGMKKYNGKLVLEGDYQQIRTFLGQFAESQRLITFNSWDFKAEDVVRQITTYRMEAQMRGGSTGQVISQQGDTATPPDASETPAGGQTSTGELSAELRDDPMLNDRTLLYTEEEFNRVMEMIRSNLPKPAEQRQIDIANLQIQQAFNRYTGGLLGWKEAESVFDQSVALPFIKDANTDIKEVLGTKSATKSASTASPGALLANMSVVDFVPVVDDKRSRLLAPLITMTIEFSIYSAPGSRDILPAPQPVEVYDPTYRSNPVETW